MFCFFTRHARLDDLNGPASTTSFCLIHLVASLPITFLHLDTPLRWWVIASVVTCTVLCVLSIWRAFGTDPGVIPPRDTTTDARRLLEKTAVPNRIHRNGDADGGNGDTQRLGQSNRDGGDDEAQNHHSQAAVPWQTLSSSLSSLPQHPRPPSSSLTPLIGAPGETASFGGDGVPCGTERVSLGRIESPFPHTLVAHRFDTVEARSLFVRSEPPVKRGGLCAHL